MIVVPETGSGVASATTEHLDASFMPQTMVRNAIKNLDCFNPIFLDVFIETDGHVVASCWNEHVQYEIIHCKAFIFDEQSSTKRARLVDVRESSQIVVKEIQYWLLLPILFPRIFTRVLSAAHHRTVSVVAISNLKTDPDFSDRSG